MAQFVPPVIQLIKYLNPATGVGKSRWAPKYSIGCCHARLPREA